MGEAYPAGLIKAETLEFRLRETPRSDVQIIHPLPSLFLYYSLAPLSKIIPKHKETGPANSRIVQLNTKQENTIIPTAVAKASRNPNLTDIEYSKILLL